MLSKPVARVTSFVATPVAALLQEIQTDDTLRSRAGKSERTTAQQRRSMSLGSCVPGQWAMWNGASYDKDCEQTFTVTTSVVAEGTTVSV